MACNLCHQTDGHKETCPTLIHVEWQATGSVWETLARELLEAYVTAELNVISDIGTPDQQQDLDHFVRHCRQAIEDGDPYTVVQLLRTREG